MGRTNRETRKGGKGGGEREVGGRRGEVGEGRYKVAFWNRGGGEE